MQIPRDWYFLGIGLLVLVLCYFMAPHFVWNRTPSFPTGLYRLQDVSQYHRGDLVYFSPPRETLNLAHTRNYIPQAGLFMKEIGAFPGDEYCVVEASGSLPRLTVNGEDCGAVHTYDTHGRPLNPISDCHTVPPGHFLPLASYDRSYDGRYYGPVEFSRIQGLLLPLPFFTRS